MDDRSAQLFDALRDETLALYVRWKPYRSLYTGAPPDIDLLNTSGATLFAVLQAVIFDDLVLRLCKLTEPVGTSYENLSIHRLRAALEAHDPEFVAHQLEKRLANLDVHCRPLRTVRNKRIAHVDLQHALRVKTDPVAGLTRGGIERVVRMLDSILNLVEERYRHTHTYYDAILVPLSADGERLTEILRRGQ